MRKRLLIYIPTLAVLILLLALLVLSNRSTPGWNTKLDRYLAYLRTIGEPSYALVDAVLADHPLNFTTEMSAGLFGEGEVFLTSTKSSTGYSADLQPVPYPPDQVWCVLLADGPQQQVVYVALHTSQAEGEWLVHIPPDPWGSPTLRSSLSNIGCNLE